MSESESRSIEQLEVDFQKSINSIDAGPAIEELYDDRVARNMEAMKKVDLGATKQMTVEEDTASIPEDLEGKAAVIIQSYVRGYLARVKYVNLLYEYYEKEEAARQIKITEQINETDILVENNKLSIDIEDLTTDIKNRNLRRVNDVIVIQRWWRNILKQRKSYEVNTSLTNDLVDNDKVENGLNDQADVQTDEDTLELESTDESEDEQIVDSKEEQTTAENTRSSPSRESIRNQIKNSRGSPLLNNRLLTSKYNKSVKETHREDVRKRLAMSLMNSSETERYVRGSSASSLQVYMNDLSPDQRNDELTQTVKPEPTDIHTKQIQLYEQATHAYAQAGPMARRLIQVKKMGEEPSEIAKMLGITSFGRVGEVTLSKTKLSSLSIDQLQIVYNAIRNEIDRNNEELVELVVVKDELHMQQDSLLLNIEDLKERIGEKVSVRETNRPAETIPEQNKRTGPLSKLNRLLKFKYNG